MINALTCCEMYNVVQMAISALICQILNKKQSLSGNTSTNTFCIIRTKRFLLKLVPSFLPGGMSSGQAVIFHMAAWHLSGVSKVLHSSMFSVSPLQAAFLWLAAISQGYQGSFMVVIWASRHLGPLRHPSFPLASRTSPLEWLTPDCLTSLEGVKRRMIYTSLQWWIYTQRSKPWFGLSLKKNTVSFICINCDPIVVEGQMAHFYQLCLLAGWDTTNIVWSREIF